MWGDPIRVSDGFYTVTSHFAFSVFAFSVFVFSVFAFSRKLKRRKLKRRKRKRRKRKRRKRKRRDAMEPILRADLNSPTPNDYVGMTITRLVIKQLSDFTLLNCVELDGSAQFDFHDFFFKFRIVDVVAQKNIHLKMDRNIKF